jgi:fermentation-respiration switch protein FrsA (DUF1100 family)
MKATTAGWLTQTAVLLVLLGVVTAAVRFAESKLAFFPSRGETRTPEAFGIAFSAVTVETADGEALRVWHLPRADARARVVYFHGNGGNLSLWSSILAVIWQQGFDVVALDYRGYGLSTGSPSERGLYRDVDAILTYVHDTLPRLDAPLVYWGRSLGTPMAAYAASRKQPDGLILESGFPTMRSVLETSPIMWVLSWLSSYRFPTAEWMAAVSSPVLVLHGDSDRVIRYRLGQRLFDGLRGPKRFVTLPGVDHNDLAPPDWPLYWDAIRDFVTNHAAISSSPPR